LTLRDAKHPKAAKRRPQFWHGGVAIARLCAKDAELLRRDLILVINTASGALPWLLTN
jgi:hypothetical protein